MLASGSLAATGSSDPFEAFQPFNITISGTWVGTWALEKLAANGTDWVNCVLPDGSLSAWATNGFWAVANNDFQHRASFRITFTRTSGTLVWEVSL